MERWKVSIAVALFVVAILFVLAPNVVLVVFAGILVAVLLHGGGGWIAQRLHLATGWGIAIFLVAIIAALAAVGATTATAIAGQFNDLTSQLSAAINALHDRLEDYNWANAIMDRANPAGLLSGAGTSAVTSTFGALGNFVIILFIGIYLSINPSLYRRSVILLFAPSIRPRANDVFVKCARTLRNWLGAQLLAMTVVGTLTGTGLWLVGMPLAIILGLLAGLLAFIPNIGPVLAIAPALLLAFPEGLNMALWVLAIYLSVQALESYLITPLIQQERVHLPPAFIITVQLFFGVMFGLLGLALATPLAALGMTLSKELYIKDYLEQETARPSGQPEP